MGPNARCALLSSKAKDPIPETQLNAQLPPESGSLLKVTDSAVLEWGQTPEDYGVSNALICARVELEIPEGTNLIARGRPLKTDEPNHVELSVPWNASEQVVPIQLVDAYGQITESSIRLYGTSAASLIRASDAKISAKSAFVVGLGPTLIHYTESGLRLTNYRSTALTVTGDYQLPMSASGNWTIQGSIYGTAVQIQQSTSDDPRFIGVNGRLIYRLPFSRESLELKLAAGIYYLSMIVPSESFGFKNLVGPQLYPTIRYQIPGVLTLRTYVKYSPVSEQLRIMDLANREFAYGISFASPALLKQKLSINYNHSDLSLSLSGIQISNTTDSVSLSFLIF